MGKAPYMVILHSSFLIDVQSSYQSGYAQLQVGWDQCCLCWFGSLTPLCRPGSID
jgi:hypothetical protein